jgi:hypothetical protein
MAALAFGGCAETPNESNLPVLSELLVPAETDRDAGNVVIQYRNETSHAVQWNIAWRYPGSSEPSGALVMSEPGQAGTITVAGGVELITAAAERTAEELAAEGPVQTWTAEPIVRDQDFHPGDIITFTLAAPVGDKATLATEVLPGG